MLLQLSWEGLNLGYNFIPVSLSEYKQGGVSRASARCVGW